MKNIKKLLAIVLALAMVFALCACGESDNAADTEAEADAEEAEIVDMPEPSEAPEVTYAYSAEFSPISGTDSQYISVSAYDGEKFFAAVDEEADDTYTTAIYSISADGKAEKLAGYSQLEAPANDAQAADFQSGSELEGIAAAGGKLYTIETAFLGYTGDATEEAPDGEWVSERALYLRVLNADGSESSCNALGESASTVLYADSMLATDSGNVIVASDAGVNVYNADGSLKTTIEYPGNAFGLVALSDGTPAVVGWDAGAQTVAPLSADLSTMGSDEYIIPDDAYSVSAGAGEYAFYYTSGMSLYGYSTETREADELFNWVELGVNPDYSSTVYATDAYSMLAPVMAVDGEEVEYDIASISAAEGEQKDVLVLATMYPDDDMIDTVVSYNRGASKAFTIMSYEAEGTDIQNVYALEDAAILQLEGRMPDVIDMAGLSYETMVQEGVLADLSSNLKKADIEYVSAISDALTYNGGIYATATDFSVTTVLGNSEYVGAESGLSYEQYNEALKGITAETEIFEDTDRSSVLWDMLSIYNASHVDYSAYTCDFNTGEFMQLLEFAYTLPETAIEGDSVMLSRSTYYTYDDIISDGAMAYVGYPSSDGSYTNIITVNAGYGIGADSADADAAWTLVQALGENSSAFPAVKSEFEAGFAAAQEVQTDENGEAIHRGIVFDAEGNADYCDALTAEQAAQLEEIVNSATAANSDETIYELVLSKTADYFAGNMSVDEAASAVQTAVGAYLNSMK